MRGASEILGLDPLYIANKGLVLVILLEEKTEQALPSCRIIRRKERNCYRLYSGKRLCTG
ncbi:MAG: hypothetical protein ACLR6J_15815 [Parabacteroides merdae]